jgi:hypothetical protein
MTVDRVPSVTYDPDSAFLLPFPLGVLPWRLERYSVRLVHLPQDGLVRSHFVFDRLHLVQAA